MNTFASASVFALAFAFLSSIPSAARNLLPARTDTQAIGRNSL
jgi:hypothetical protein